MTNLLAAMLVAALTGPSGSLQHFAQVVKKHYCPPSPLVERYISFKTPLGGEPPALLYFHWKVTAEDEYGKNLGDELSGIVWYSPTGRLQRLIVAGPLVHDMKLRQLRSQIRQLGHWPSRTDVPFGPHAEAAAVAEQARETASALTGVPLKSTLSAQFRLGNPAEEPDATWRIEFGGEGQAKVRARVEPFSGQVIEVEVCGTGDC